MAVPGGNMDRKRDRLFALLRRRDMPELQHMEIRHQADARIPLLSDRQLHLPHVDRRRRRRHERIQQAPGLVLYLLRRNSLQVRLNLSAAFTAKKPASPHGRFHDRRKKW